MATTSKSKSNIFSNIQYPYEGEWDAKTKRHVTFTLAMCIIALQIHFAVQCCVNLQQQVLNQNRISSARLQLKKMILFLTIKLLVIVLQ